jgi:Domain of unknown function (DUF5623)
MFFGLVKWWTGDAFASSREKNMSINDLRPITIMGIKSLARDIHKSDGVRHNGALDRAAAQAGYSNFRHAQRALNSNTASPAAPLQITSIYVTMCWRDSKTKASGYETVRVSLSQILDNMIKPAQYRHDRWLGHFRRWAGDHLISESTASSIENAKNAICGAARVLQFMCATGLRPSSSKKTRPRGYGATRIPGADHASTWYDPSSKTYIAVDEPYSAAVRDRQVERREWATCHNWDVVKSSWAGMYNPDGGCEMYLLSDRVKGYAVQSLEAALARIDEPIVADRCDIVTLPGGQRFKSPGEIEKIKARNIPAAERKPRAGNSSVPYSMFMSGNGRRPDTRMSINAHSSVGALLKLVISGSYGRAGVIKRAETVRCELDNWVQLEYDHGELPNDQFFELYYRDLPTLPADERGAVGKERNLQRLSEAKSILLKEYPDCAPLRRLVGKIDAAVKSLQQLKV